MPAMQHTHYPRGLHESVKSLLPEVSTTVIENSLGQSGEHIASVYRKVPMHQYYSRNNPSKLSGAFMAKALYGHQGHVDFRLAAEVSSLRARVSELEALVANLSRQAEVRLDDEARDLLSPDIALV